MKKLLPTIVRNKADHSIIMSYPHSSFSLIWLHGLGDSSEGFYDFFAHPLSPVHDAYRVKLLQAPLKKITINNGQQMNSWYNLKSTDRANKPQAEVYDLVDIKESCQIIDEHVEQEISYWKQHPSIIQPEHRIVIGGFSQGCVMSLKYGLQRKRPLAGILGLSGFLLPSTELLNLGRTNIVLDHGQIDSVIPLQYALHTYKRLKEDPKVKINVLKRLQHNVTLSQLKRMNSWLKGLSEEMNQYYSKKQ